MAESETTKSRAEAERNRERSARLQNRLEAVGHWGMRMKMSPVLRFEK